MKALVSWFAENHVAANLMMILLVLGGVVTASTMKLEVFPESSLDTIRITVSYPGASPAEVEEGVVRVIEENVAGLTGIKRVDSTALEGYASINIEVIKDWDIKSLLDEVKSTVDRIRNLPEEAEEPVIRESIRRSQVIRVAVYGEAPRSTLVEVARQVKDEITADGEITAVDIYGVQTPEIQIEIDEHTLRRHGLTLSQVAKAISASSMDLPAGSVETSGGEILVRAKGRRYHATDYADIALITRPDGTRLTLGQIANLKEGTEDRNIFVEFQGKPAVIVAVSRVADQNALSVAASVKKTLARVKPLMPRGIEVDYYDDMSDALKSRLELLGRNLGLGLILVCLLLGLFMNWRLAFWVALGIPISFLAGIWVLPGLDVSINMVSLFAFIMVLGIVVDDAIVVGEHVFTKREQGVKPLRAAIEGTLEIGRPVIFSVLTTVAAFYPLLGAGGMMGKIMRNIPMVVITVLMASLAECLFILPSHLNRSRFKVAGDNGKREMFTSRALKWFIRRPYTAALRFCLANRYVVLAAGIALLFLAAGLLTSGQLKFVLFPKVESDALTASLVMPAGTPIERTQEVVDHVENSARQVLAEADAGRPQGSEPLLRHTISYVGMAVTQSGHGGSRERGTHLGQIYVILLDGEERDVTSSKLARLWRQRVGTIPDAESFTFSGQLFRAGNPIEIHLSAPDDETLKAASADLKERIGELPGTFGIGDSFLQGKLEMQLKLKPSARTLGLTLDDLARQVRHALYGAEALRFQRDQDEVKVMIRYPEENRKSLDEIERMRIRTPEGAEVPFSLVAEVNMDQGYSSIERAERRRVIKVYSDVDQDTANSAELRQAVEKTILPDLLTDYPFLRYSTEGEGREQRESLTDVYRSFAIALFVIYALLAVPFRSFTQPLIVMAAIPFGLGGALAGHVIMGYSLSMLSLFGMVGLTGVVVNDSLVLIHAANGIRAQGRTPLEAILAAGPMRFRAIILTSLTTFAGVTPMLMEKSLQAQFLIPMAVSLGFGVLFATLVTLLLIPCGYLILEDLLALFGFVFGRRERPPEEGKTYPQGPGSGTREPAAGLEGPGGRG